MALSVPGECRAALQALDQPGQHRHVSEDRRDSCGDVRRAANVPSMEDARRGPALVSRRAVLGASVAGMAGLLAACGGRTAGPLRSSTGASRPSTTAQTVPSRSTGHAPTVAPRRSSVPMGVQTGLARLIVDDFPLLRGRKVGVLTNPTGVTASGDSIVDVLHATRGVDLR